MSKNIHDLSDDEFDDLFRDSAEKGNIGFDPEAWNKMTKKLDAAAGPPSGPGKGGIPLRKWILPSVIILLLLITGTYFLLRTPSEAGNETKAESGKNQLKSTGKVDEKYVTTDKVDTENKDKASTEKAIAENTGNSGESAAASELKPAKEEKALSTTSKQPDNKAATTIATRNKAGKALDVQKTAFASSGSKVVANNKAVGRQESSSLIIAESASDKVIAGHKTNNNAEPADITAQIAANSNKAAKTNRQSVLSKADNAANTPVPTTGQNSANRANSVDASASQQPVLMMDSATTIQKMQWAPMHVLRPAGHLAAVQLKLPAINFESSFITPSGKPRENTAFRRGLSMRLALSPDFSFIPSNSFFKVGNNWAAIIEYRFNNRLSIQSGVIRSMKLYNALPDQYEWNIYYPMPSPVKDIDATCKMLDIPLNLRYDITRKANSRWFVGAGFTSYVMLKEEYQYNFENPSDPNIKRRSWEGKTGAYPFSVFNLSTGYERQVFRRLTFQAEPFFKAPLGKVGYGKVRLATAGIFFSVKYPF